MYLPIIETKFSAKVEASQKAREGNSYMNLPSFFSGPDINWCIVKLIFK